MNIVKFAENGKEYHLSNESLNALLENDLNREKCGFCNTLPNAWTYYQGDNGFEIWIKDKN